MKPHWTQPDYDAVHAERFRLSLEWLRPHLTEGVRVLSLGDAGRFEEAVHALTGTCHAYGADLRAPFDPQLCHERYDLVLCMEVLEHIHDREAQKPTEWRATGTANLLQGVLRALRPGGLLFLTTPNACSLNVLNKVLTMQPPMVYRPHVREYAPAEIDALLKGAGLAIERFETCDPWGGGVDPRTRPLVEALLASHAHASPHRGEDIFVLARKPANA